VGVRIDSRTTAVGGVRLAAGEVRLKVGEARIARFFDTRAATTWGLGTGDHFGFLFFFFFLGPSRCSLRIFPSLPMVAAFS